MEALRQTNQHGKMVQATSSSSSSTSSPVHSQQGQGLAALLVMVAVLCFIVAYCCWGAPCCRAFCRRRCCCHGDLETASPSDLALSVDQGMVATPTIILLPYGRMLVVDGSVFAQLQADTSGLDLIELGENVVRAQHRQTTRQTPPSLTASTPSVLDVDSETFSKDGAGSPVLSLHPPPTYDSIFGSMNLADLPPSYEEILHQIAMQDMDAAVADELECIRATDGEYEPGEIRESRV